MAMVMDVGGSCDGVREKRETAGCHFGRTRKAERRRGGRKKDDEVQRGERPVRGKRIKGPTEIKTGHRRPTGCDDAVDVDVM